MSELQRLLVSSEDELERALLGSVLAESPGSAGLRDTALALGLTATTATALVTTLPSAVSALGAEATSVAAPLGAAAVAPTVAASGVVATASAASFATLGKSLLGGALLSFLALTTVDKTMGSAEPSPSHAAKVSAVAPTERIAEPPPIGIAAVEAAPSPTPAPEAPVGEPNGRRPASRVAPPAPEELPPLAAPARAAFEVEAPRAPTPAAATAASLAAETRLLDKARSALARGDTSSASQSLQQYYSGRPSAVLAQEAALLHVRLLLATGERAAAAAQARRIISLYPGNAHADSLRRLAAEP